MSDNKPVRESFVRICDQREIVQRNRVRHSSHDVAGSKINSWKTYSALNSSINLL